MTLDDHLRARERTRAGALPAGEASEVLAQTLDAALGELGARLPPGTGLFAVGGTGRRRLTAHTDVDLAIVSRRRLRPDQVRPVLLPLWDAGLKVGHSVRTIDEATTASTDPTVASALLTRRLVAGDPEVGGRLTKALARRLDRRSLRDAIVDEERGRRRADPFGSTFPDLKVGRGGLRTLDLVVWLDALDAADLVAAPTPEGVALEARLMRVRVALHVAAGSDHDRLEPELVGEVARRLRSEPRTVSREVLEVMDAVEDRAGERFPDIVRVAPAATTRPPQAPVDPTIADAVAAARTDDRLPVAHGTRAWTGADRQAFRWLLAEPSGREVVDHLRRRGWLAAAVPELDAVWLEPHLVPFHRHPVGGHSVRVLDELRHLDRWQTLQPEDREVLEWAAIFHDLGKGSGDHAEVGARRFDAVAARLRIPVATATSVRRLIRLHLLLADLGTRHDLQDPDVVSRAAAAVSDERTVHLLGILTAADSRATGTDTWTPWRRSLIEQAERVLAAEVAGSTRGGPIVDHLARVTGLDQAFIISHLAALPDGYRRNTPVDLIARHLTTAASGSGTRVSLSTGDAASEVVVVAPDRPGLLADIAGALAGSRCSIVESRCLVRSDGVAIDTFVVLDWLTGAGPGPDVVETVRSLLDDPTRIAPAADEKEHAYRAARRTDPVVLAEPDGGAVTLRVTCSDQLGLLRRIAHAVHRAGGTITEASLDTIAGLAEDRFTVAGADPTALATVVRDALVDP